MSRTKSGGFLRDDEWVGKERLREERLNAGLSRREAAEKIGISVEMWRKIENGERKPGLYTAQRIHDLFAVLGRTTKHLILVYPDGNPVGLDLASGGYPYKVPNVIRTHVWESEQERDRYMEMFKDLGFKKATLRVEIQVDNDD